jgi:hypothetical protein
MPPSSLLESRLRLWQIAIPESVLKTILGPAQILMAAPCFLFLAALTAMLFRHPDAQLYEIDPIRIRHSGGGGCGSGDCCAPASILLRPSDLAHAWPDLVGTNKCNGSALQC